jgi:sortase A
MRKKPVLTAASLFLVITGMAVVGLSVTHIERMNSISGSQVLPEMEFHSNAANAQAVMAYVAPARGDYLGTISIPALKKTLPIFQGTENAQLEKGVGHFEGSVLPGQNDNSVLAGHRDGVFSQFGKLKVGDLLIVDTSRGNFTYKISRFRIVGENDRTVIVPTKTAVLTLSTCYPFYYIGNAPRRFIVSANLIQPPQVTSTLKS